MKLPFSCNPVLGNGPLMYDVEAHEYEGRLYFYGGFREDEKKGSESGLRVVSTDDMANFTDHGFCFTNKDVRWRENNGVWAPDCACRDGVYYLYYCTPDRRCGVAKSDRPYGPFSDIGVIEGIYGIDPTVLVDDDGQAYIYYGQMDEVCVAKLNPDMASIDVSSIRHPLSVREHNYHEGISIRKHAGRYYLVYTDTSRHANIPMCQGWAVSDDPMTGFQYKGVLIDNYGCDPMTWNNHGSIACYKGQWYIFYHKAIMHSNSLRQLVAEKLTPDENGDFHEVPMTSSGIYGSIPSSAVIPASVCVNLRGNVRVDRAAGARFLYALTGITEGDTAGMRYVDMHGEDSATVRVKSGSSGYVEFFFDGVYAGFVPFEASEEYREFTSFLTPVSGLKTVEMRFFGHTTYETKEYLSDTVLDTIAFTHA